MIIIFFVLYFLIFAITAQSLSINEGKLSAEDLVFQALKASGTDEFGWILLWSSFNMVEGTNYLAPKGNATRAETAQMIMAFMKKFGR